MHAYVRIAACTLLTAICVAGSDSSASTTWGGYFALNYSSLHYDEMPFTYEKTESRVGYSVGIDVEKPLNARFGLASQLRYTRSNARVVIDPKYADGHFDHQYSYVSIPVVARVYVGSERTLFFELGPEIGVTTAASVTEDYRIAIIEEVHVKNEEFDIKDDMAPVVFSSVFGAGFRYAGLGVPLVFRLAYSLGLTNVSDPDHWVSDWKLNVVSAGLTAEF